jgi:hypothetical protein
MQPVTQDCRELTHEGCGELWVLRCAYSISVGRMSRNLAVRHNPILRIGNFTDWEEDQKQHYHP